MKLIRRRISRKIVAWTTILVLMAVLSAPAGTAFAYTEKARTSSADIVTSGVTIDKIDIQTTDGVIKAYVMKVDLTNQYVKVDTIIGKGGYITKNQGVRELAAEAGAVAAVNGDFFMMNQNAPLGLTVQSGQLVTSPAQLTYLNGFGLTSNNVPVYALFNFEGTVTSPLGVQHPLFGLNKPTYNLQTGKNSDFNRLNMYDSRWGANSRGGPLYGLPGVVEMVVEDNIVREIRHDQPGVPIPQNGYVLAGQGTAAQYVYNSFMVGDPVQVTYSVTPGGSDLSAAIGGQSILVKDGLRHPFSENITGKRARTAIGSSQDGSILYLVVVEGGGASRGMTQEELADFMISAGAWNALNLDGGGSSTMVARNIGDTSLSLINTPVYTTQRPVPTGIGIFSTAPQGEIAGFKISGPKLILVGVKGTYSAKAYDEYFNPYSLDAGEITWNVTPGYGQFQGNSFTASRSGDAIISASYGNVTQEYPVKILGSSDIAKLEVTPSEIAAKPGDQVSISVKVTTKQGTVYNLQPGEYSVQLAGDIGIFSGNIFTASEGLTAGEINVKIDSTTATIKVRNGNLPVFTDINGSWAKDVILEMASRKVVSGYPDGTFRPGKGVTRAEFVTLLANTLGWQNDTTGLNFKDSIPAWAAGSIGAALSRGVVRGYDNGTFQPHKEITRAEMAVILDNALALPDSLEPSRYSDAKLIPSWAVQSIRDTKITGIMQGSQNLFRPGDTANRAEATAVMSKVLAFVKK